MANGRGKLAAASITLLYLALSLAFSIPVFTADLSPNAVSTGQNVSFTLVVSNTGSELIENVSISMNPLNSEGKITSADCDASRFSGSIITGTNLNLLICLRQGSSGISTGQSATIRFNFSAAPLSKPIPNPVTISIYAYNTTQESDFRTDGVEFENAASLSTTLSSPLPSRIIAGQTGIFANFTVINNGDATASTVTPAASIGAPYGSITPTVIPAPQNILGGGSRTFEARFDLPSGAASSSLTLNFNATGTDVNSLLNTTTQASSTATVYLQPNLQIYSITPNITFASANPGYRTVRLSVLAGVLGSAATISEANITGFSLKIVSGSGVDESSSYTSPLRTDSVVSIAAGTNATLTFELSINNPGEGQKYANVSLNYNDGIAGISPNQTALNNGTIFAVDNTNPTINIVSATSDSGAGFFRQGETITVSSTVTDALSGIGSPSCSVSIGGISAGTLSFTSNSCNGTVQIPQDSSIYGSEILSISTSDAVGNLGTGTLTVQIYTLAVNTTDILTGADIKDGSDLSNATVYATNSSGGQTFSCTPLYGTKTHLCGVPLGTVVNISATSPAYVRSNNTTDSSRICVGTGTLSSCAGALPSGGFAQITISLTPNTKITVLNEFNRTILYGNVTVGDSAATPWYKSFMDGGAYDHNTTINGIIVAPIDTGKHTSPFQVRFNLDASMNPGYLAATNSNYVPSQENQTNLTITARFTIFVRLFTEFGAPLNTTTGTVSFSHSSGTFPCIQNPANYSEYGCLVPTLTENPGLSSGGNITITKPGYVTKRIQGAVPPANPSAAQVQASELLQFDLAVRVTDEFGLANLTTSEVSRVSLISSNCTYGSGGFWGCPAVSGDEIGITVEPLSSSGYLVKTSQIIPFVDYVQSSVVIPLKYSLKIFARDELGNYLNATNISEIKFLFGSGVSCTRNGNTSEWGCPVSAGTAAAPVHVNASSSSGRLNYVIAAQAIPANTSESQLVNYSANNFTIRVLPASEMGTELPLSGLYVSWGGQNACIQSGSYWYCPANASIATNVSSGAVGFINYLNSSVNSPALSGSQLLVTTANKYSILVNTLDEFGTPRNFSSGRVSFGSVSCVSSAGRPYEWGCPSPAGTLSQANVSHPGYINFTSPASYTAPEQTAAQVVINSANKFTLRANIYDELGQELPSAQVSSGSVDCYLIGGQPVNSYFCPLVPPQASLTISKTGFVSSTVQISSLNYTEQQVITINSSSTSPKYSAVLTIRRSPSSNDETEMTSATFFNLTNSASIPYSQRVQNRYYFALAEGSASLIIRHQSTYVDRAYNFTTSSVAQHVGEPVLDYPLKAIVIAEDGAGIEGATLALNVSGTFIESNTISEYYSSLANGAYSVYASKVGFVTSSPQAFSINTTYPANQTTVQVSLKYTLKVVSNDWGGAPLNGTTISVTGQSILTNPESLNTAYFPVNPATSPVVNVTVSKTGYNTVAFVSVPISASSQNVTTTSHAQNIIAQVQNWAGSPLSDAVLRLHSNGAEVADCVTTASGTCTFVSTNGISTTGNFNSSEMPPGASVSFSAEKPDYWNARSGNYTYAAQNSSPPQSLGALRIGIPPKVLVVKGWNTSLPVDDAAVVLNAGSTQISSNSTDSGGYAIFLPNYSAASSGSDFFISGAEASSGANLSAQGSKTGYSGNITSFSFSPDTNSTIVLVLSDSVPPQLELNLSGRDGTAFVGFENFNVSLFSDELYPQDSSGVNYSGSSYRISWANGTIARGSASLSSCSGYWCNLTEINGWDLPVGSLYVVVNVTDGQGNWNSTNISFVSAPGLNETFVTIEKSTASSAGDDFFLVTWGLVVKGTQGKLRASNLYPVNCSSSCAEFPIQGWANLVYTDVASCYGTARYSVVKNTFPAGQTPATFCDYDFSTQYAREQNVSLKIIVPTGLANARYNASYYWTALQQDLPRANVSVSSVTSSNSSPETGTNFTVTVRVYDDANGGTADDILVSLNSTIGSVVYPANQTISQIYSGQYGEANFTVMGSPTTLGTETLTARIHSGLDANSGWPATISVATASTAVVIVDLTAPFVIQGTSPLSNYNYSSPTVQFDTFAFDNFRLNYTAVYGNWSGGWGAKSLNSTPLNNTWWNQTIAISDGIYLWGLFANDTSGNWNLTANRTFTVDTVAPSSVISAPVNTTNTTDSTPTITGTASDATSGVRRVWLSSDGSTWNLATGTTAWTYTFGTLSEGIHVIESKAEDWAGNNQSAFGEVYITIDTVAPFVIQGTNPLDTFNSSLASVTFDLMGIDNLFLHSLAVYGNWSGGWGAKSLNSTPLNNTWWNSTLSLPDGYFVWGAYANDSSGNGNFSSANRTLLVDTTAPSYGASLGQNTTEINVSLGEVALLYSYWSDALAGLAGSILSTNETGAFANYTSIALSGSGAWSNFTWTNTTALANGTAVAWRIWANDTLGNWNLTTETIITVIT
ncbi:MAG: hypothetical protein V1820_03610 [archaeon]